MFEKSRILLKMNSKKILNRILFPFKPAANNLFFFLLLFSCWFLFLSNYGMSRDELQDESKEIRMAPSTQRKRAAPLLPGDCCWLLRRGLMYDRELRRNDFMDCSYTVDYPAMALVRESSTLAAVLWEGLIAEYCRKTGETEETLIHEKNLCPLCRERKSSSVSPESLEVQVEKVPLPPRDTLEEELLNM